METPLPLLVSIPLEKRTQLKTATSSSGAVCEPRNSIAADKADDSKNENVAPPNVQPSAENCEKKEMVAAETLDLSSRRGAGSQQAAQKPRPAPPPMTEGGSMLISDIIDEVVKNNLGVNTPTSKELVVDKRRLDALTAAILPCPTPSLPAVTSVCVSHTESLSLASQSVALPTKLPEHKNPEPIPVSCPIPVSWTQDPNKDSEDESVEVDPLKAMAACRVLLVPHEYEKDGATPPAKTDDANSDNTSSSTNETKRANAPPNAPVTKVDCASTVTDSLLSKRKYMTDFVQTEIGALDMSCKKSQEVLASLADSDGSNSPKRLKIVESE